MSDLHKCVGDFLCRCLGFLVFGAISCFETVTQHIEDGSHFAICDLLLLIFIVLLLKNLALPPSRPGTSVCCSQTQYFVCLMYSVLGCDLCSF